MNLFPKAKIYFSVWCFWSKASNCCRLFHVYVSSFKRKITEFSNVERANLKPQNAKYFVLAKVSGTKNII